MSRTRHTLRRAEFGFFGVVVYTRMQTPRRWGEPFSAGVLLFSILLSRPLRTSWAMVGIMLLVPRCECAVPAALPGATDPGVQSGRRALRFSRQLLAGVAPGSQIGRIAISNAERTGDVPVAGAAVMTGTVPSGRSLGPCGPGPFSPCEQPRH